MGFQVPGDTSLERLLRELAPQVLAIVTRRYGSFDLCEDAVQEALLSASTQWPQEGLPSNPKTWLVTVAGRRRIEMWRNESARRRREETAASLEPPAAEPAPADDDTLTLLMLCCHPALTLPSQVPLTLRAVGGLTTAEIARALLVPESTVGQRISRAKQRIKAAGATFRMPPETEYSKRLSAVLHVLYLIFNEGYTATAGTSLNRVELSAEAIRLARQLQRDRPDDGEVAGLLALMLLNDARRPSRTTPDGRLVPLADQDRTRWDRDSITEGIALVTDALSRSPLGPYQLQAAIAAVHDEAEHPDETDWRQILGLYDLLRAIAPSPMVTLNRIVAVAMVNGSDAGLRALAAVDGDPTLKDHYRVDAVRAHLLEQAGAAQAAREHYLRAARRTLSWPEQQYLESRAAHLASSQRSPDRNR